jgi:hypothetical protein
MRKASEGLHHSPGQVEAAVAEAIRIVESHDLEVPDVQDLVAAIVVQLLSKQVLFEQVSPAGIAIPPNGFQG